MSRFTKVGLIVGLVATMGAIVPAQFAASEEADSPPGQTPAGNNGVPKLLDLGSKSCIPCKKMAPILEELKTDYAGEFDVEFVDVGQRENASKAKQYGVKRIPTQIFFDRDGKELWRHEGFLGKEEILAKWRELGFRFEGAAASEVAGRQPQSRRPTQPTTVPAAASQTVGRTYPGLASAALVHARPAQLPEGILLRAGDLTITQEDVDAEISKAPPASREQLRKNAFFLLEQMTTRQLLTRAARDAASGDGKDAATLSEQELLKAYFDKLADDLKVSDAEVAAFYAENNDMVGGQALEDVKDSIANFLRQKKQRKIVDQHVRTLGQRTTIELAAPWLERQAALAKDNPVDKARASDIPSMVDFGSKGCRPCDMLRPILANLREKFDGRANILFVSVREKQILASRYGVHSIPTLIFFDKNGKEVFRHTGFMPQEQLEKKLAEIGVE